MSDEYFTCPKCGGHFFGTVMKAGDLSTVRCKTMSDGGPEKRLWTPELAALMNNEATRLTQCDWVGPRTQACKN
jgi:hypothetical protein